MVYLRTWYWREYLFLRQRKWQEAENLYNRRLYRLCLPSAKCMEWFKVSSSDSLQPKYVPSVWIQKIHCKQLWCALNIWYSWSPYFVFPLFAFVTILHISCKVPPRCPQEQCYIFLDFKFPQPNIFPEFILCFFSLDYKNVSFLMCHSFILRICSGVKTFVSHQ
jgi:hypothetical protein